jgi:tetratricopeptide (TPR) repeat protein
VLGLARARERQGDRRAAEATLRTLPMDADAVEALAALLVEERPAESVALYRTLGTLRLGDPAPLLFEAEAALRARDVGGSVTAFERYLTFDGASRSPDRVVELMVGLATAYKDAGDREAAKMWLRRAIEQAPEGALAEEARARLDRVIVEEAADSLALGGAEELDPTLSAALDLARRALAEGDPQAAARRLEELSSVAPRSPEIWGALGEARLALGDVSGAEQSLMTAVALQPDEANWRVSLGRLIAVEYAGRRHREAIEELSVALTLRPSWTELRYHLGVLHQESGEGSRPSAPWRSTYAPRRRGSSPRPRASPSPGSPDPRPEAPSVERLSAVPPEGVPPEAWRRYRLAQVYLRDRQDDAGPARRSTRPWP